MTNIRKTLGFNDYWLMLAGIPIIAFIINLIMFPRVFDENFSGFLNRCFTIGIIYTATYWFIFRYLIAYGIIYFPKQSQVWKRILIQVFIVVFFFFVIKIGIGYILSLFFDRSWLNSHKPGRVGEMVGSFLSIFLIWAIYESIIFYTKLQKSEQEAERLQKENIQSQLEGLKNQVNPHFLFNSLNTLTYLIPEDPDKAVGFVQKLSKVYRYILEIRDKKIISIGEEIEFLNAYIFLLKERFGDNLNIQVEVSEDFYQRKIVPLSLQILFENVIKHNIISTQRPLMINVFIEKDQLIVKNNLQKKNQVVSSTKLGLQNIKNRYRFFTEKEVEVIVTPTSFLVALPLVDHVSTDNLVLSTR